MKSSGGRNLVEFKWYEFAGYEVAQWTPLPGGMGKPEQVHLVLHMDNAPDGVRFAMRLKSRRAAIELIDTIRAHADEVWPPEAS